MTPSSSSERTTASAPVITGVDADDEEERAGGRGRAVAGSDGMGVLPWNRIEDLREDADQPVVAPSAAERTSREYFARTPRV
ncbi:hypothetical protein GCM10010921_02100 [Microbacterium album]|uniref:Uncharacterized protein n=1 Tax=Microbacterium album TaxID=2053191 RepID=A0A917ICC1_9MICO|nr:hypothetical protein GCM10010921_02100 [Microbacterium album]